MTTVETVRGAVDAAALGPTLAHEHIVILQPEALENYAHVWGASYWDEEAGVADAIAKLQAVKDAGIDTIVDPTAPGLGRNVRRIARINDAVDLHIVVATGVYAFIELPNFLRYRDEDDITELFVRELRVGIDDTGIRAAFLKCAVEEPGLVGDIPRIIRTVAAASLETGAPIMVHTNAAARTGLLALEAFVAEGVDPTKVQIAHAGDSNDLEYLRAIAGQGATLGCDRFGIHHFNPDERRIETLLALIEEGYADQIILSHDSAAFMDFFTGDAKFAGEDPSYLLISERILPALRERGVTQEQIDAMLVGASRRFLAAA